MIRDRPRPVVTLAYYYNQSDAVYRTAPFSMTLSDPNPDFTVSPLFDAEYLRNARIYIVSMK